VTLAAAAQKRFSCYLIGDILDPLVGLWDAILTSPADIAEHYRNLWRKERARPIEAFYDIRADFNADHDPAKLLYLLARCVKNSVRFNPAGEFNQSPDKRRTGTRPETMESEILAAHHLLAGKCRAVHCDFFELIRQACGGDIFYLDPPYQGTSGGRDRRYFTGVTRARLIEGLELLNDKGIPFILSYDGSCGHRSYGEPLPEKIGRRILLDVGRSSQATLNGRKDVTVESLYVSHLLPLAHRRSTLSLDDFSAQAALFA
jgi:DNA adenine methylase